MSGVGVHRLSLRWFALAGTAIALRRLALPRFAGTHDAARAHGFILCQHFGERARFRIAGKLVQTFTL